MCNGHDSLHCICSKEGQATQRCRKRFHKTGKLLVADDVDAARARNMLASVSWKLEHEESFNQMKARLTPSEINVWHKPFKPVHCLLGSDILMGHVHHKECSCCKEKESTMIVHQQISINMDTGGSLEDQVDYVFRRLLGGK
jgi:hypothetical protein